MAPNCHCEVGNSGSVYLFEKYYIYLYPLKLPSSAPIYLLNMPLYCIGDRYNHQVHSMTNVYLGPCANDPKLLPQVLMFQLPVQRSIAKKQGAVILKTIQNKEKDVSIKTSRGQKNNQMKVIDFKKKVSEISKIKDKNPKGLGD